jgi:UDP-N-acetylglucosamine--N-acetylmuramyl-(pentapeptide) pyrophosphoryl-undecaprenol N-acetylglucosamine transferase
MNKKKAPPMMTKESSPQVGSIMICAGGTGGHIFPGIALGQALHQLQPDIPVHFLCGTRPLEARIYKDNGITPLTLPSTTLSGGIIRRIIQTVSLGLNVFRSLIYILRHRVRVIVGMGGYTMGPAMAAAWLLRRKRIIHEANAVPGNANRWIAPFCHLVTGHFPESVSALGGKTKLVVGMPIRPRRPNSERTMAYDLLGLDPTKKTLLISGGSQGARSINAAVINAIRQLDALPHRDFQILWATGHPHHHEIQKSLEVEPTRFIAVHAVPFIQHMDYALLIADGAITRAGASTIAELVSAGVFPILIPFPFAVHNHQVRNAEAVVHHQAGWMLEETDLAPDILLDKIRRLMDKIRNLPPRAQRMVPSTLDSSLASERLAKLTLQYANLTTHQQKSV